MFQQVHKYQDLSHIFTNLESGDWVIFDVDDVLTVSSHPAFQTPNITTHQTILSSTISDLSKEERQLFFNLALIHHNSLLLDPLILEFLTSLNKRNIHTVALTAVMNGSVGTLESMAQWRYKQLKDLGIEFIHPYLKEEFIFNTLPAYQGFHPSYYKGILFQNSYLCSKGDVLKEYLNYHFNHPKQIIMIDDRDYNLESISKMLSKFYPTIKYQGIWFKAADYYCSEQIDLNANQTAWAKLKEVCKKSIN